MPDHPAADPAIQETRALYLNVMKRCLLNLIYFEGEARLTPGKKLDFYARLEGKDDGPVLAHSMIGLRRLENIQACVETVLREAIPGDLLEAGVWRGGASIFMRAILKAYGVKDRAVWVADSFEGLPPPNPEKYPADAGQFLNRHAYLAVSLEAVRTNFSRYDLLDDQVHFLKGWFRDSLPSAPVQRLAVLRLDGDLYESTMDGLTHLYPKLSVGGFAIIDDYGALASCRQAVIDYRAAHGIVDPIETVDWTGAFWRRSR